MHPQKRSLLWINALGGLAVLGSYVHGLATHPATRGDIWGGVPEALQPLYTGNMLLAAAGYFAFSAFVFFRLDPDAVRVAGRFRYGWFHASYALMLVSSALWMPLTFAMLEAPGPALWWAVRLVLFGAGIGSAGVAFGVYAARPHDAPLARRLALVGCTFFCLQTAVLDALVWPAYFPA